MAIAQQAFATSANAAATSHTFSVTVSSGTSLGLLVAIEVGLDNSATISGLPTFNGANMALVGVDPGSAFAGLVAFYYKANPAVTTANVAVTLSVSAAARCTAWVLTGAEQSTPPTYLGGTGGVTTVWSWSSTVGAFIAVAIKRGGTVTWTDGGGLTADNNNMTVASAGTGLIDTIAAGHLIATTTSAAPQYTLSGGDSSTNVFGSVQWLAATGAAATRRRPQVLIPSRKKKNAISRIVTRIWAGPPTVVDSPVVTPGIGGWYWKIFRKRRG